MHIKNVQKDYLFLKKGNICRKLIIIIEGDYAEGSVKLSKKGFP